MNYFYRNFLRHKRNLGRLSITFLDNSKTYVLGSLPRRGPLGIVWDINNRCNLRCAFCNYWKMKKDKDYPVKKRELTIDEKKRVIHELGDSGVGILSFCSGEPLLSEELTELIKDAKSNGMLVNISTNGYLLKERAENLIKAGTDSVTVSIDSHEKELHDKLRGVKGAFDKALEGVKSLSSLKKNNHPVIQVRCLINNKNRSYLKEYIDFWRPKVDEVLFKPIYKRDGVMFEYPRELNFDNSDKDEFKKYFSDILGNNKELDNLYNRGIPDFIFGDNGKYSYPCLAGVFFGEIDCSGNLYFCQEMEDKDDYRLGDLSKSKFIDLWGSHKAVSLRKKFKKRRPCECWMERMLFNIYVIPLLKPFIKVSNIFKKENIK